MKFCSYHFIIASVLLLSSYSIYAQDVYKDQRSAWLQKAEDSKPVLIETIKQPVTLVTLIQDNNVFQHWKARATTGKPDSSSHAPQRLTCD